MRVCLQETFFLVLKIIGRNRSKQGAGKQWSKTVKCRLYQCKTCHIYTFTADDLINGVCIPLT